MSKPQLELLSLRNACQRLAEGWIRYQQNQGDTQLRDGLIQRFEFTSLVSGQNPNKINWLASGSGSVL